MTKNPLESLITFAAHTFHVYSLVLFRVSKTQSTAEITLGFSRDEDFNPDAVIYPGVGMVGWILKNKKPLLSNSFREVPSALGYYKIKAEPGIGSFFGIPLDSGEILCMDSLHKNAFPKEIQNEILAFAKILCKTDMQQDSERKKITKEHESTYMEDIQFLLSEKTAPKTWKLFLHECLNILKKNGFEYAALVTRKSEERYFIEAELPVIEKHSSEHSEYSVIDGIAGWAIRNGEPIFNNGMGGKGLLFGINGGLPAFTRTACAPIIIDSRTCGVLCLGTNGNHNMPADFRRFFLLAAEIIGQKMKSYSLRQQLFSLKKQLNTK